LIAVYLAKVVRAYSSERYFDSINGGEDEQTEPSIKLVKSYDFSETDVWFKNVRLCLDIIRTPDVKGSGVSRKPIIAYILKEAPSRRGIVNLEASFLQLRKLLRK